VVALVEQIERDIGTHRGDGVQHRRQRAVQHPGRDRAQVLQDLGDGLLQRLSGRARGGQAHGGARARHHLFTGATAGLRGSAHFAAFAGAKHALRALAQSMARELGPRTSTWPTWWWTAPSTPPSSATTSPSAMRTKEQDGILNPDHIADNYWHLHQPAARCLDASSWTCAPGMERW
jgi:NAD(P)-dependent dehydrogenase (short-subunit alcohol dehydrogenase family)